MDEFITDAQVSEMTQGAVSTGNLAQRRFRGLPPAFYKPSPKVVLYKRSEVLEWLEGSRRTTTPEVA